MNKKLNKKERKETKKNKNKYIKDKEEISSSLDLAFFYIVNYFILFLPSLILYFKYGNNIFVNQRLGINMSFLHLPMIGMFVGLMLYLSYRKKKIKEEDIKEYNRRRELKIIGYNFIVHFVFVIYTYIFKENIFKNLNILDFEKAKIFEEIIIFICSYFFINIFASFNIYSFFVNKYEIDSKNVNKEIEEKTKRKTKVRNSFIFRRYIRLLLIILILNIPTLFLNETFSILIYAFSVIIATLPFILKTIKIIYEEEGNKTPKEKVNLNKYIFKKQNLEKNTTKKRKYLQKVLDFKSILYPYIFEIIVSEVILSVIIYFFGNKIFNLEDFPYVLNIVTSFKFLIDTYALLLGLKIYDNYIKYGIKERKKRNLVEIVIGLIFAIIFVLLIYIFPYKMMNLFTCDIAAKNSSINILKYFMITSVVSFLETILIYVIYGKIRKKEIQKRRYNYRDMSKESKKIYNLNSAVYLVKVLLPYLLIILAIKLNNYKAFLYSYFISDIISFVFSLIVIRISESSKNKKEDEKE